MAKDLLLPCEMCAQSAAPLTLVFFGMGEGYDLCPPCLSLKQAFDDLIEEINQRQVSDAVSREKASALLNAIGRRCGRADVEFFQEKLAEEADYDVAL